MKKTDCDIIDINMGCPVTKIVKSLAGSALMKDVDHAVEMSRAVVQSVKTGYRKNADWLGYGSDYLS